VIHALLTVFDKFMFKLPPGAGHLAFLLLAVPLAPLSYRFFENRLLRFRQPRQRATAGRSVPATEHAVG
jgi:peptidoglycan/LPS O-acetylase OafA/YrhL